VGEFVFRATEAALLGAPFAAFLAWLGARRWKGSVRRGVFWALCPSVAVAAGLVFKTSFVDTRFTVLCLAAAYVGCGGAAGILLSRSRSTLAFAFGTVMALAAMLGCVLGTVGVLAVGLVAAEHEPTAVGRLGGQHRYVVTRFGNVFSAKDGWAIAIYRRLSFAPFLEREVFAGRYETAVQPEVYSDLTQGIIRAVVQVSDQRVAFVPLN